MRKLLAGAVVAVAFAGAILVLGGQSFEGLVRPGYVVGTPASAGAEGIPGEITVPQALGYTPPGLSIAQVWTGAQTFGEVLGTDTAQSGTTYTFAASDCGTTVNFSNAGAITATIPATLPLGCTIAVQQTGAGKVSVNGSAVTPATLHSFHSYTGTAGQYAIVDVHIWSNSGGSSAIATLEGDGS
jgi:hypothetical protein